MADPFVGAALHRTGDGGGCKTRVVGVCQARRIKRAVSIGMGFVGRYVVRLASSGHARKRYPKKHVYQNSEPARHNGQHNRQNAHDNGIGTEIGGNARANAASYGAIATI